MKYMSWFSGHLKRGTVFARWVIMFFVLVLVALLIMSVYFYNLNAALEKNLEAYSTAKNRQISKAVDASAAHLAMIAANLRDNLQSYERELLYSHETRSKFISDLAVQLELNRDIFGVYIYLPETNEIISSEGIVKERYFHSGYFDTTLLSYETWHDFLLGKKSDYFCFFPFFDTRDISQYKITYVLCPDNIAGKIMVALNTENLLGGDPYFSKLFVADETGALYNLYGKKAEKKKFSATELPKDGALTEVDGNSYASSFQSIIPGLTYIILTNKNVLNKDLNVLQHFSVLYMLVFLIIGLTMGWFFSLWQYKPLSSILGILKNVAGDTGPNKNNEYIAIERSISNMLREKAALMRAARKGEIYQKEKAVSKLLNGRTVANESSELIDLSSGLFSVVRIIWNEENSEQFKNDFELLQFAVKNVAQEIFSEIAEVYPSASDGYGTLDLLLVFQKNEEGSKEKIMEKAENFIHIMKSRLDIETGVVLGRMTDSVDHFPMVYSEVLETSLLYSDEREIIDASALADRSFEMYSYSMQTEMEIIFHIKKGDYKGAYERISREINEILYRKNYPAYMIRCFMIELAGTILKAVGEIENRSDETPLNRASNVGKLFSATTIAEMELLVQEYLKEVCDFVVEANLRFSSSSTCEGIKQYVRENYANTEMNVNAIAEKFCLNSAYLSNMFKRNTGIKLLDYINKVRVDEAKKLMIQNPDISVEELAEKSGFSNSRTFRRVFMKYENTSPSKFIRP